MYKQTVKQFSKKIPGMLMLAISPLCSMSQNTGTWQKTNGPGTNQVMDMISYNNQLYLGTEGGIYKSADNGTTWNFSSSNIPYRSLYHLLATSQAIVSGSDNGIYRSTDAGSTWSAPNTGASSITQLAQSGNTLFASTQLDQVKRSTDGGLTWSIVGNGVLGSYISVVETHGSLVFVDGPGKLISSNDYGTTWTANSFTSIGLPFPSSIVSLASTGTQLFAGMSGKGLYLSSNNGASFTAINNGLPTLGTFEVGDVIQHGNTLLVGLTGQTLPVYRSTDGGQTWQVSSTGMNFADGLRRFFSFGNKLFASTLRGLYSSSDGGLTWLLSTQGITNGYIDALASNSSFLFAGTANRGTGGTQSIYRSANNGQSWQAINQGISYISTKALFANDSILLLSGNNSTLYRSTNNGQTWTNQGIQNNLTSNVVGFTKKGNDLFMITDSKGVYKSSDQGITWTATTNSASVNQLGHAIHSDSLNVYIAAGVFTYYSADQGQTWINTGAISASTNGTALHTLSNYVFLGTRNQGMYKRLKSSSTWTACNNGLPQPCWVSSMTSIGDSLFIGTDYSSNSYSGKIYMSTDLGNTWTLFNQGLPSNIGVRSLLARGKVLVAGTGSLYNNDARSVWCNTLAIAGPTLTTGLSEQSGNEQHLTLFPNPNNGLFEIHSELPLRAIEVTNTLHTLIYTEQITEGQTHKQLNFMHLPNGIYFVRCHFGDRYVTHKIVIAR